MAININFFDHSIRTTVTCYPDTVPSWINNIEYIHRRRLDNLVVGLDIEWLPNYNRYAPRNPISVLQLCVGHHCLVFQLQHACYMPQSLHKFLSDGNYTFVGVGIDDDVQKLYDDYNLEVSNTVDLRNLASIRYDQPTLGSTGLVKLAQLVLGLEYNKPKIITISNWSNLSLSEAQVEYAAIDAFLSFEIGKCLDAAHF